MSQVKFPYFVIGTELRTLPKELLDCSVVFLVPVNLGLRHQNWDIFFEALIELL
jgi:hypothetical protein